MNLIWLFGVAFGFAFLKFLGVQSQWAYYLGGSIFGGGLAFLWAIWKMQREL